MRVLDLCTGSGIIGVTIALEKEGVDVTAADISEAALGVARKNAEKHLGDSGRIEFVSSDLFENLSGEYDMILTNPPYIASDVIPFPLAGSAAGSSSGMDGGADGLSIISRIAGQAVGFLKPGGWIMMEIGHDQEKAGQRVILGKWPSGSRGYQGFGWFGQVRHGCKKVKIRLAGFCK